MISYNSNADFVPENRRRVMESHIFGNIEPPKPKIVVETPPPQKEEDFRIFSPKEQEIILAKGEEFEELPPLPDFALPNLPAPDTFSIPMPSHPDLRLSHGRRLSPVKSDAFSRLREQLENDSNEYNSGSREISITRLAKKK